MRSGQASVTAQLVAAHRLGFERLAAPFGDPEADQALQLDVGGERTVDRGTRMARYLQGRTAFFDRVVLAAIEGGTPQVVVAAAGYDARSLRYAAPGVRWFEVDHPDTQADKLARLARLGLDASAVSFVPADFAVDPIAERLAAAGHRAGERSLFLAEGIAVYLDRPVLARLVTELRATAAPGSRLAISLATLSVAAGSVAAETRRRFRTSVAAYGEPAAETLSVADAMALFADAGWHLVPSSAPGGASDRAQSAGLLVLEAR